jgi:hypothetical protein
VSVWTEATLTASSSGVSKTFNVIVYPRPTRSTPGAQ